MWVNPITDRNILDVQNKTSKGFLNHADLNRIDGNIDFLCKELNIPNTLKTWLRTDFPTNLEMQRILNQVKEIKDAYQNVGFVPPLPVQPLNIYFKFNTLETILKHTYIMVEGNKENKHYTGEVFAGDNIGVI